MVSLPPRIAKSRRQHPRLTGRGADRPRPRQVRLPRGELGFLVFGFVWFVVPYLLPDPLPVELAAASKRSSHDGGSSRTRRVTSSASRVERSSARGRMPTRGRS